MSRQLVAASWTQPLSFREALEELELAHAAPHHKQLTAQALLRAGRRSELQLLFIWSTASSHG
jgi:hypothetical protein